MRKLLATIHKECRLLWHDKIGLFVLFIMPMFFILIISLLQASSPSQRQKLSILLINHDSGNLVNIISSGLQSNKFFIVDNVTNKMSIANATTSLMKGKHQALIIIPKNASKSITSYAKQSLVVTAKKPTLTNPIQLIFDPTLQATIKTAIKNSLQLFIQKVQMQAMADAVSNILGTKSADLSQMTSPIDTSTYLVFSHAIPNPVQQNVPAWTIFGMFFIVIPLAGVMIKERSQGIAKRLRLVPFCQLGLLSGRVMAFSLINIIQLLLMFAVGIWILPLLGLPTLLIGNQWPLVLLSGLMVALAATGFGIFIGSWTRTFEQAAAIGPILIVIAAAVGGIMVPLYMMPTHLQVFADLSPLYWGQSIFIDLLVRHADFGQILPGLLKLLGFFVLMILGSKKAIDN